MKDDVMIIWSLLAGPGHEGRAGVEEALSTERPGYT